MAYRSDGLKGWYGTLYFITFLSFLFTMGYGIGGFTVFGDEPEWSIHSVVFAAAAGITACLLAVWNRSAPDDERRIVSRVTSVFLVLLLILFSYRLLIAPAVFDNFGSGTEKAVMSAVMITVVIVLASFVFCWYRIVIPKIRYTVYYDGGIPSADCTSVSVTRTFRHNPLLKLTVSACGVERSIKHGETATIALDKECFRITLRYGLAKRDIVISDADCVTVSVGYDYVSGVLIPSVGGMPHDTQHSSEMQSGDDVSRYL